MGRQAPTPAPAAFAACPFCGEHPTIQPWHGGPGTKVNVSCPSAYGGECFVVPSVVGDTEAEALERWNRRAPARRPTKGDAHVTQIQFARYASMIASSAAAWAADCMDGDINRAMKRESTDLFTDRIEGLLMWINHGLGVVQATPSPEDRLREALNSAYAILRSGKPPFSAREANTARLLHQAGARIARTTLADAPLAEGKLT